MDPKPEIPVERFFEADLRVARITACEPFPEARKPAYKLTLDLGPLGTKRSSARLPTWYEPGELEGRLVVVVANFPPRRIGPVVSEVLVLGAVGEDGEVVLLSPDRDVAPGVAVA